MFMESVFEIHHVFRIAGIVLHHSNYLILPEQLLQIPLDKYRQSIILMK